MEMRNILSNTPQFSSRAAYFSGRGAILCDLDDKRLTYIHAEIIKHFGQEAGDNFVLMVLLMPNMNATDFINNCYTLENNGFKWNHVPKKLGIDIEKDEQGEYNLTQGMFGLISALTSNNRDETEAIRGSFLRRNGIKSKPGTMTRDGNDYYYNY